jgi:hypothetical protein
MQEIASLAAKKVAFQEKAKHKAAETAAGRIAGVSPCAPAFLLRIAAVGGLRLAMTNA